MILNKYSLNGKTHPHFKFETFYINFQEGFIKFAFFKELVLKLIKIIYYFTYRLCASFFRYRTCCFRKLTNFSKKKFNVIKRGKYFKFQIGGLTYQMKIDIYDNYVCSELNFFYFRKGTYLICILYKDSVASVSYTHLTLPTTPYV